MSSGEGTTAILAAFFANLGIAIAKFIAFLFTRSSSMLAESIHSVADTGNQALLLFGGRQAKRAPTETHPFGYGRSRYFWAFVVALVLFSLGSLFALFEGFEKVQHAEEVESAEWALGVLGMAMVLESFSFRMAIREANPMRRGRSWWRFIRESRAPELPVVLLEDLGALIGLIIAFAAVSISAATGDGRWDGYGTLAIGVLLGVIAIVLALEMRSLLLGESATRDQREAIERAMRGSPQVERIIHLRTQHLGPDELLVGAKIAFEDQLSMGELADAIDALEARVRDVVPIAARMYIEPDLYRPERANGPSDGPELPRGEH